MKKIYTVFLFALFWSPCWAADSDLQEWSVFTFQGPKNEKLKGYFEVQPRFGSNISRMYTIMVRPAVQFSLSENSSVWLGYAWTPLLDPTYKNEQRLQQYFIQFPLSGFTLVFRTRLEERWVSGLDSVALRFRQLVRFQLPITQGESNWAFISWNEIFFHLNSPAASIQQGYNQNRFFIGFGRSLYPGIRFEEATS